MAHATSKSLPSGEPAPPRGLGLTALALGALIVIELIRGLFHLVGGSLAASPNVEQLLQILVRCLVLLLIWQYWKGREFARIFVLLWSLLVTLQTIAFLADHNLDPAALMSHPLRFFHALLAVFLLYWLNTPTLLAWFKKTSATAADFIAERLVGKLCTALDVRSPAWRLNFEHGSELTLGCPFRIVLDDNLAFTSAALPHESASVPDPSGDPDDARRLLQNLRVTAVRLAPRTSDLFLTFEMGIQLQTWSPAPAAGSPALPNPAPASHAPLWSYSDPALTVIATADGVSSQLAAPSAEPHAND
jgi:hypothetical protein